MRNNSKQNKPVILVDMDDTATMLLPTWVDWLNEKHSLNKNWKDVVNWDLQLAFPTLTKEQIYEPLRTENFWDSIVPREGAVECLTELHEKGYEIYICTATDYRNVKPKYEKVITKYFPFIDWQHVIVAYNKQMIQADFIIDDAPQNLIGGCQRHKYLISMPHNENMSVEEQKKINDEGIRRSNSWAAIGLLIHFATVKETLNKLKEQSIEN